LSFCRLLREQKKSLENTPERVYGIGLFLFLKEQNSSPTNTLENIINTLKASSSPNSIINPLKAHQSLKNIINPLKASSIPKNIINPLKRTNPSELRGCGLP